MSFVNHDRIEINVTISANGVEIEHTVSCMLRVGDILPVVAAEMGARAGSQAAFRYRLESPDEVSR